MIINYQLNIVFRFPFSDYQLFIINYQLNIVVWSSQSDGIPRYYPPTKDHRPKTINQRSQTKLIFKEENNKKNLENKKNGCNFALANAGSYSSVGQSTWLIIRESLVQAQVGPLLKNQAVTRRIVAAFSFPLNTNLNTTPRQCASAANGSYCVHAPFQILCSHNDWWKGRDPLLLNPICFWLSAYSRSRVDLWSRLTGLGAEPDVACGCSHGVSCGCWAHRAATRQSSIPMHRPFSQY